MSAEHLYCRQDLSSFANPLEAVSTHIKLDWDINFDTQTITGSCEHIVRVQSNGATHVHFDSSMLNLTGDVLVNNEKGSYTAAPVHPVLGTKLSVEIPEHLRTASQQFSVQFFYHINTNASAMQWLAASATKGKKHPYLFTQSQAIHARSLFPCMDSPGIKTPYAATVTAPKWCTVLMSALANPNPAHDIVSEDKNVFVWNQPVPTPAYLIALAAGHLESREISKRVRVWAEPEVVEEALYEFSQTEDFLQAAESLTGCPYAWHRYDILCLPPSFPYGGMENPCLTFATPTLLAGDKSLADVIAHEIAHSWTGNLVTNHTWDHFWLNEGWTVWLERKITSKVHGGAEHGLLSSQIGWKHLQDDIQLLGADNPNTSLVWQLEAGEDPDNAYSSVPYEKGCNLLLFLEQLVGAAYFEPFVRSYIEQFKFKTVTTGEFRDHFVAFYEALAQAAESEAAEASSTPSDTPKKKNRSRRGGGGKPTPMPKASPEGAKKRAEETASICKAVSELDWEAIFFSTGLPPSDQVTSFQNTLSAAAEALAAAWIQFAAQGSQGGGPGDYTTAPANTSCDISVWSAQQKNVFLEQLLQHSKSSPLSPEEVFPVPFLECLDATYNFSASHNAEIMLRWQSLCLLSEADWITPHVVAFITSQGRMKFARPLYRLLRASSKARQLAIDTFELHQDTYHPIARKMIAADLKRADAAEAAEAEEALGEQVRAEAENAALAADLAASLSPPPVSPVSIPSVSIPTPATPTSPPLDDNFNDNTPASMLSPSKNNTPLPARGGDRGADESTMSADYGTPSSFGTPYGAAHMPETETPPPAWVSEATPVKAPSVPSTPAPTSTASTSTPLAPAPTSVSSAPAPTKSTAPTASTAVSGWRWHGWLAFAAVGASLAIGVFMHRGKFR